MTTTCTTYFGTFVSPETKAEKFWSCTLQDSSVIFHYGKSNMTGRKTIKNFDSTAEASKYMNIILQKKQKKGYVFKNNDLSVAPSVPVASTKKKKPKPIITEEIRQWKKKYHEVFGSNPAGRYANKIEWLKEKIQEKGNNQPTNQETPKTSSSAADQTVRNARFHNIAEKITPYYKFEGQIVDDIEFYSWILSHPEDADESKRHYIANKQVNSRIQNYIRDKSNNIEIGDIIFAGCEELDRDNCPIEVYLRVVGGDYTLQHLYNFKPPSDFRTHYSDEMKREVQKFCIEQMEECAWDEEEMYYQDFTRFIEDIESNNAKI